MPDCHCDCLYATECIYLAESQGRKERPWEITLIQYPEEDEKKHKEQVRNKQENS